MVKLQVATSLLLSLLIQNSKGSYYEKIEAFSFDSSLGEYPLAYVTFGSAINLENSIKLVPPAQQLSGAIFLNQPLNTPDFQFIVELEIKELANKIEKDEQQGFAMWYLHHKPRFPEQFGNDLGYITSYNGIGVFVYKDDVDQEWKLNIQQNDGMSDITFRDIKERFKPDSMGCNLKGFSQGKLRLMYQVLQNYLTIQYSIQQENSPDGMTLYNQCINEHVKSSFDYQGFLGFTSSNKYTRTSKRVLNDISVRSIDFFNMNADNYQNVKGIEKRDFFNIGRSRLNVQQYQSQQSSDDQQQTDQGNELIGKLRVYEMKKSAVDLFEYKRIRDKEELKEEIRDMSNIRSNDSPDEQLFKIYEQTKAYNNRLQGLQVFQKELKADLKSLEEYQYHNFTTFIQCKHKRYRLLRYEKRIGNLISSKSQSMGSVEYFMPPTIISNMASIQKEMAQLEQQFMTINRGRTLSVQALESFLIEFIRSYTTSSLDINIDAFSLALNKKFDLRMEQYQKKVQESVFSKNFNQTVLIIIACFSLFLVQVKSKRANQYKEKDQIIIKNYQLWEGTHKFFFQGRLMVGPKGYAEGDSDPVLIIIGVLLWFFTNYFLFKTALSDPGFIPRQTEDKFIQLNKSEFQNYLIKNGQQSLQNSFVRLKFCKTCNIYRPPRTVHCSICDSCVQIMDHHCPWVSNCIGKRNYRRFFIFANFLWANCLFVLITSATDIQRRVNSFQTNEGLESSDAIQEAFKSHPLSLPIIIFCFLALVGLSVLLFYHYKITLDYITTHEELKGVFSGYFYHPFNAYSFVKNFKNRIISIKISRVALFQPTQEAQNKLHDQFDQGGLDTNKSGLDKNTIISQSEDLNLISQSKLNANTNDAIKYHQDPVRGLKDPDDDFDKLESLLEEDDLNRKDGKVNYDQDGLKKSKKRLAKTQGLSLDLLESRRNSNGAIETQMTPSINVGGTFRESIVTQQMDMEDVNLGNIKTNRELMQSQEVNIEIISSSSSGHNLNFQVQYNDQQQSPRTFKAQRSLANSLLKSAVCYQEQDADENREGDFQFDNPLQYTSQLRQSELNQSQNLSRYSNSSSRKSRKLHRNYNNIPKHQQQQQQQDSLYPFAQDPNYPYGVQFPQETNDSKEFEFLVEIDENKNDLRSSLRSVCSSAVKFEYDKENQSENVVSLRSNSKPSQPFTAVNQNVHHLESSQLEHQNYQNYPNNYYEEQAQAQFASNVQNDYYTDQQHEQNNNMSPDNGQTAHYRNPFERPSQVAQGNQRISGSTPSNNGQQQFNALRDVSKQYFEDGNTQQQQSNNQQQRVKKQIYC
eukprot:403366740